MTCPKCLGNLAPGATECANCQPRSPGAADAEPREPALAPAAASDETDRNHRPPRPQRRRSPFVGRVDELNHLEERWRQARNGSGGVVVISGEAGIGKTRLTVEMLERARAEGALVFKFQGAPQHANSELYPLLEHLFLVTGVRPRDPEPVRQARLERLLADAKPQIAAAQLIACLVELGRSPGSSASLQSPWPRREQILTALLSGVCAMAEVNPILLVAEDAQWFDPTSVELVERIVRRAPKLRMLLLVTARREFIPDWINTAGTSLLVPRRLNASDSRLLAARVPDAQSLSPSQVSAIVERSEGVPLFIEALARELASSGPRADPQISIPQNIQAMLTARLDRLGAAKRLAQILSAAGRRFSHDMAAHVWLHGETDFATAMQALMASEFLQPMPIAPDALYAFRHALFQEAAYASQSTEDRQQAHAAIVAALEAEVELGSGGQSELVAYHCDRAGLHLKAATHWLEAGKTSATRGFVAEAVDHFRAGIAAASSLPEGQSREQLTFELNMNLGPALMALKGYSSEEGHLAFLTAKEGLAHARSSLEQVHVFLGLFNVHFGRGQLADALEVAQQADKALSVGYGGYPVLMGQTLCMMGRFNEAHAALEKALATYKPSMDAQSGLFCRADVVATSFLAKTEFALGNVERSVALTSAAMSLARLQAHPVAVAIAYLGQLFLAMEFGDLSSAQAICTDALDFVTRHDLTNYRQWILYLRAVLGLGADAQGSIAEMERLLVEAAAAQTLMFRPTHLAMLGAAYGAIGLHRNALSHFDEGLALCEQTQSMEAAPALYRFRAKTMLKLERPTEALQAAEKSLSIALQQSARIEQVRTATLLARMHENTNGHARALQRLSALLAACPSGHQLPDLRYAARILASSGTAG